MKGAAYPIKMNVINSTFGTVLLVGGAGFIGHHIINDLLQTKAVNRPDDVHVYDVDVDQTRPHYSTSLPAENYHQGDITDAKRLEEVVQQVQPAVVIDLVAPAMFAHDLAYYMKVNVDGRRDLLRVLKAHNAVKAYIYNSSAGVVHDSYGDLINATENLPVLFMPEQREPYSHSKAVAETMVLESNFVGSEGTGLLTAAIRLCSPFGAGHGKTTNNIIENARQGKYRVQVGDGKNLSDWTYIENAARAFLLMAQALLVAHNSLPLRSSKEEKVDGEAFFVSNDEPIPFWEFARKLGAAGGYPTNPTEIKIIPSWVGMTMAFLSEWFTWLSSFGQKKSAFTRYGIRYSTITRFHNIDKAKQRLKYRPMISLDEGIKRAGEPLPKIVTAAGEDDPGQNSS